MPWRKCPCTSFSMHDHLSFFSIDHMFLHFRDIMGHVINEVHTELFGRNIKERNECLARPVHQTLPVRPCIVCCCFHCGQVVLRLPALVWGAREFFVG